MNQLEKPISTYVDRFNEQYQELNIDIHNLEALSEITISKASKLNNLFMAGLGAATLILRLGAVINLCRKLEEGSPEEDALLLKQIIENLRDNLPSDTNWKTILSISSNEDSPWNEFTVAPKGGQSVFEKFISFRNKFVHRYISINPKDVKALAKGIAVINQITNEASKLFVGGIIKEDNDHFFYQINNENIPLHPFVQKGKRDGLPYIFQGLYNNQEHAEIISTYFGDVEEQDNTEEFDEVFEPMREALKGGAGKVFDHSNRIEFYNECFVGRDKESKEITDWSISKIEKNILPIYSSAGMGKGALIANAIVELESEYNLNVLHHFCGTGIQNNLQAVLYHFILQGKRKQIWKTEDDEILQKLNRLPSKYPDLINLFHLLIDDCYKPTRKNTIGNLAIIIDGLDEAAVANPDLNISEWFKTYNEDGEPDGEWMSKQQIRWIFTYREGFYNFPEFNENNKIESLQPLVGLSEDAVKDALSVFNPSQEFLETVNERGKVI